MLTPRSRKRVAKMEKKYSYPTAQQIRMENLERKKRKKKKNKSTKKKSTRTTAKQEPDVEKVYGLCDGLWTRLSLY